jgi:hypothetical protein
MKNSLIYTALILIPFLMSCAANKAIITVNDITDETALIIGVIEYDYSGLKQKTISGVDLFIDSKEDYSDFMLQEEYSTSDKLKRLEFISTYGKKGLYGLCYKSKYSNSSETGNLLTLLDMEQNPTTLDKYVLYKYTINKGLILNIGKVIVKYQGGTTENGNIKYTYSFETVEDDTLALSAFKATYPEIYEKYKSEIYDFVNEFNQCVKYVINNVSMEKGATIRNYIDANPDQIKEVFKELRPETQDGYVTKIESLSPEELNTFLTQSK